MAATGMDRLRTLSAAAKEFRISANYSMHHKHEEIVQQITSAYFRRAVQGEDFNYCAAAWNIVQVKKPHH